MSNDEKNGASFAWLQEIARFWDHYNWEYLGEALKPPSFRLSSDKSRLGSWDAEHRIISICVEHILKDPWIGVMETLRHEMAHQYVSEVLRVTGETAHGPAFRRACHLLRVSPAASGNGGEVTPHSGRGTSIDGTVRDKITKLLSLATSPNEHEAQSAMTKARYLLLKYNLSLQDVANPETHYIVRQLGGVRSRRQRWDLTLGSILARFFFVEILWGFSYDPRRLRRGSVLLVHGSPVNVETAEYVFDFLNGLLPRLWTDYRKRTKIRSNAGRLHYYWGVLVGFEEKLENQNKRLLQEQALVWKGDPGLKGFYRYLNPRIQTVSSKAVFLGPSFEHGRTDGKKITLNKPVASRGDSICGYLK